MEDTDITYGIESKIWNSIDKSIEINSKQSFFVLDNFVRDILSLSIKYKSLKHFESYINFPAFYYSSSYEKAEKNATLMELHKYCSNQAAKQLKEIISYNINFDAKNAKTQAEKSLINQFYYLTFHSFCSLLYFIVNNEDINQFRIAINDYEQISNDIDDKHWDLQFEIDDLIRSNNDGGNDRLIQEKSDEYKIFKAFDEYKRHALTGIKYWIIYLYRVDKISEETVSKLLNLIKIPYADSSDLLNDILLFRNNTLSNYMGWRGWDYLERQSGKVYNPPDPHYWLTSGFFADQLRESSLYVNLEKLSSDQLSQLRWLYNELVAEVEYLRKNFDKWKSLLKQDTEESFQKRCDEILKDFALAKRKSITDTERAIAKAPLFQPNIDKFKEIVGKAWGNQAIIHGISKCFKNTIEVTDPDRKLKYFGQQTYFEKAKTMFIEQNYDSIYGVERMGGEIGRSEDDYFFNKILQEDLNIISRTSVLTIIDEILAELKKKSIVANLILISPLYTYKNQDILSSNRFISKSRDEQPAKGIGRFMIGTLDDIPVCNSFSNLLKNRILICNFDNAFQMSYKSNPEWYDNELCVEISLISDEEAEKIFKESPEKWAKTEADIKLSKDESLLLIKTSVKINLWTNLDFEVKNKDAYIFGFFKSETI